KSGKQPSPHIFTKIGSQSHSAQKKTDGKCILLYSITEGVATQGAEQDFKDDSTDADDSAGPIDPADLPACFRFHPHPPQVRLAPITTARPTDSRKEKTPAAVFPLPISASTWWRGVAHSNPLYPSIKRRMPIKP